MKDVDQTMTTTLPIRRRIEQAPSFAAVAEQHLDDVYRYLLVFTRDPILAEDLAGETFERALRTWRRFDPRRASARTWLCLIARSAALDHFRSEKRRVRREEAVAEPQGEVDAPEIGMSPQLERALGTLSAADREVIALRVVLDLDSRSAANLLGVSQSACTTRLNRALKRLEQEMTSNDE
jgi:RNA polymerase sigma factor (sigma-70 family)